MTIIEGIVAITSIICLTFIAICIIYKDYYKGDDK